MSDALEIRIGRSAKRIKVNDAGEYITLDFDDQGFLPRFFGLVETVQKTVAAAAEKEAELNATPEISDQNLYAKAMAKAQLNLEICKEIGAQIDAVFGDEVCRKVFGDIVPSVDHYVEFFAQLKTLIAKFAQERREKMQRHTAPYTNR